MSAGLDPFGTAGTVRLVIPVPEHPMPDYPPPANCHWTSFGAAYWAFDLVPSGGSSTVVEQEPYHDAVVDLSFPCPGTWVFTAVNGGGWHYQTNEPPIIINAVPVAVSQCLACTVNLDGTVDIEEVACHQGENSPTGCSCATDSAAARRGG